MVRIKNTAQALENGFVGGIKLYCPEFLTLRIDARIHQTLGTDNNWGLKTNRKSLIVYYPEDTRTQIKEAITNMIEKDNLEWK